MARIALKVFSYSLLAKFSIQLDRLGSSSIIISLATIVQEGGWSRSGSFIALTPWRLRLL
jgi:hypothetical protein